MLRSWIVSSALTDDDGAPTLDFEQTLERLLGLVNREVEVAVRAQGATSSTRS